jgi:thiamine pyrophosphokinase
MNFLLIANGSPCSKEFLYEECKWASKIIVLDGAYNWVQEFNLSFDYLIGDFDSIDKAFLNSDSTFEQIYNPDQNSTDLEKGINFALENKASKIRVLNATGRRMDHTFANISILHKYQADIEIKDEHSKIYRLPFKFEHFFQKGQIISLLPIGIVTGIQTENLKYSLNNESLELGLRNGNSNEVLESDLVRITYKSGCLLLMECWD